MEWLLVERLDGTREALSASGYDLRRELSDRLVVSRVVQDSHDCAVNDWAARSVFISSASSAVYQWLAGEDEAEFAGGLLAVAIYAPPRPAA